MHIHFLYYTFSSFVIGIYVTIDFQLPKLQQYLLVYLICLSEPKSSCEKHNPHPMLRDNPTAHVQVTYPTLHVRLHPYSHINTMMSTVEY